VHVQKESTLHLILRRQSPRILETEVRGRSVEVSGSGGALRSVTLLVDGVAAATATSDGAGVWQVTIELEPGEHELTAAFTDELGDPLARSPAVRVTVAEPPAAAPPAKEPAPAHAPEVAATRPVLSAATTRGRCVTPAGWLAPRPPRGRRAPFISFRLTAAAVVRYALIRRGGGARGRGKRAKEGERPGTVVRHGVRRVRAGLAHLALATVRHGRPLPPGAYALRLEALDADGGVVDQTVVRFRVGSRCAAARS
jgi:hypothetical protein